MLPMALTTRCFSDFESLQDKLEQWDKLACALDRPLMAPAILRAWWEHMRPEGAELRLIAVSDGEELVGFVSIVRFGRSYSWAGRPLIPGEPLAKPGLEAEVAAAIAADLAAARPRPLGIEFEIQGDSPEWASLLCGAWPKPRRLLDRVHGAVKLPHLAFDEGGFDAWMQCQSANFRKDMKRKRRRLEERGASLRFSDLSSLRGDIEALIRLHLSRQDEPSVFEAPGAAEMLHDVGTALIPEGRFRHVCVDLDGRVIGCLLVLAAGSGPSAFVSGFDEEFAELSPNMVCFMQVIEDMAARGERWFSLGSGGQRYKFRFANGEGELARHFLLPLAPRSVGSLAISALGSRTRSLVGRGRS